MNRRQLAILLIALLAGMTTAGAQSNTEVLKRMLHFGDDHVEISKIRDSTNVYTKYSIDVKKRNVFLASVPTMFYILRGGKRHYFSESYSHVRFINGQPETHRYLHLTTVYHRKTTLPSMIKYLTPRIYEEKLFQDGILSPINYHNRKYYKYRMKRNDDGTSLVMIKGRFRNTQLIRRGYVVVKDSTGQVLRFQFEGEYDMIRSALSGTMRQDSGKVMMPEMCDVKARLSFVGNKINMHYISLYDQFITLPDSIENSTDRNLMDSVRPIALTEAEKKIIREYEGLKDSVDLNDSINKEDQETADTTTTKETAKKGKRRNWAKYILWDILGDNMLNKIRANIGEEDQGQIRIGPIFNPFYFGYTKRKGLIYRLDLRAFYNFNPYNNITARVKLGYSFKQKQLFFNIPIQWNFNKPRNGYVLFEYGNGNRISNSRVLDNIKAMHNTDSIDWNAMHLDYFRDMRIHVGFNIDIIRNMLGVQAGFTKHRRSAVDASGFRAAGRPTVYKTFAPFIQLQYRPLTDRVPLVITSQWEHGVKHFGGQIAYDRFEFDGQYVHDLPRMRSWQLRTGFGFYTHKGHEDYFLDYHNFQEDYISLGWEDKWSGEFEMLNANWYNASDYYFRANATYEAPLLLLSFCPVIGQIVEKERIYLSALAVRRMFPYIEAGYGFTNRVFSMGIFTGWSKMGFEGVGMKFGFELFNNY